MSKQDEHGHRQRCKKRLIFETQHIYRNTYSGVGHIRAILRRKPCAVASWKSHIKIRCEHC